MSQTQARRDPISLLGFSIWWASYEHWDVFIERRKTPWRQYILWLCAGRLALCLRVHLPWRKP